MPPILSEVTNRTFIYGPCLQNPGRIVIFTAAEITRYLRLICIWKSSY